MRRGHTFGGLIAFFAAAALLTGAPAAWAEDGSPGDICQQVQAGLISANDPIVQGYCGPIVPVTPPVTVTPVTPPVTGTPPVVVAPTTPPASGTAGVVAVVTAVKGASHTSTATPSPVAGVQGQQHTVKTPVTQRAGGAAPLGTQRVSGTLPFTGAQLGLFAIVGLALLATGLLLRSTGRPSQRP